MTVIRYDADLNRLTTVLCGHCHEIVPDGTAHIVLSPKGPNHHIMYCPDHCPCQRTP
jgi:hypothetical protein